MFLPTGYTISNCTIHFGSETFYTWNGWWLCFWYWSFDYRWSLYDGISITWCKWFKLISDSNVCNHMIIWSIFWISGRNINTWKHETSSVHSMGNSSWMVSLSTVRLYQRIFRRKNWIIFRMVGLLHLYAVVGFCRWNCLFHIFMVYIW